jgi:hypothetical protein
MLRPAAFAANREAIPFQGSEVLPRLAAGTGIFPAFQQIFARQDRDFEPSRRFCTLNRNPVPLSLGGRTFSRLALSFCHNLENWSGSCSI